MRKKRDWMEEVVHDLKTPLTAAKGFIDLAQNLGPLSDIQREYIEKAIVRLDYMQSMINQLLELAPHNKSLPVTEVDFDQLLSDCVETIAVSAAARSIMIYVEMPLGAAGHIYAETNQLNKVMLNLLNNAIKYNIDGGSVYVQVVSGDDMIEVSVADTGLGIAQEDQERVFDRFFRSQTESPTGIEGTGLGLSIVKMIVEKHGGEIGLVSELNKGTTVTFMLPRRPTLMNTAPLNMPSTLDVPLGITSTEEIRRVDAESTDTVGDGDDAADVPLLRMPRAAYYDRSAPELAGEVLDGVDDNLQESNQEDISDADAYP